MNIHSRRTPVWCIDPAGINYSIFFGCFFCLCNKYIINYKEIYKEMCKLLKPLSVIKFGPFRITSPRHLFRTISPWKECAPWNIFAERKYTQKSTMSRICEYKYSYYLNVLNLKLICRQSRISIFFTFVINELYTLSI